MPEPEAPSRGYLPFAAYPSPGSPPAPTWTKAYEHPTARRVVSTGLQLAVEANRDIRRASIYIGVLALGAFGPAVILLLIGIARLLSDPSIAATIASDPSLLVLEQPEIAGPLSLIYVLLIAGGVLLIGISVDAQAMAISILGGRASDQPLRLWEAIVRARQVFWRLLAADIMVGAASVVVSLVITIAFFRPFESNAGVSFFGSMIGTLLVTPFAFAAAGIVLGDVGAVEALRRSMGLFRARPRISLVVTLFTLVTSAIQSFAISAGADAAVRVGEILHLGLDQGPVPLVVTVAIVLAFIVAFGSLTFTIAAIVAAPQVTGFLGLTYYSGGLDKARGRDGARPRRFRWVSVPMILAMIAILGFAGFGLPSVAGFTPRAASPLLAFLRPRAQAEGSYLAPSRGSALVEDPAGDQAGYAVGAYDLVTADYGYLPDVPAWLLSTVFDCLADNVACGDLSPPAGAFDDGAYLFFQRMAGAPGPTAGPQRGEWGPVLLLARYAAAADDPGQPFSNASHAIVTRVTASSRTVIYLAFDRGAFADFHTSARSTWVGNDLVTIVPVRDELQTDPVQWDMYAGLVTGGQTSSRDSLRPAGSNALRPFGPVPTYRFFPLFAFPT